MQPPKYISVFVRICDAVGNEDPIEVPTEMDGTLLLSTVTAQFPGSVGLRYQGGTGLWRACRMIGGVIDPPLEGWNNITFSVVKQGIKRSPGDPTVNQNHDVVVVPNSKQLVLASDSNKQVVKREPFESKYNPELMIANVSYSATEDEIRHYFESFGELEKFAYVIKDGKPKGYGFIKYKSLSSTNKCRQTPHTIHDRKIDVSPTREALEIINKERANALVVEKLCDDNKLEQYCNNPLGSSAMIPDIMIANLGYIAGDAEIRVYFEGFGELEHFSLAYDNMGKSKGFGFIKYKTAAATKDCLNTTHTLHGRILDVRPTKRSLERLQIGDGVECLPNDNIPTKLFVGRLPHDATESDLHQIFKEYSIKSVNLPRAGTRGCGFITLTSIAEAYRVMNNSHMWKGKCLNVSAADKREAANPNSNTTEPHTMNELNEWMLDRIQKLSQMTPEQRMQAKLGAQRQELLKSSNATAYDYGYGGRIDIGNTNQIASNPSWGESINTWGPMHPCASNSLWGPSNPSW